MIQISKLPMEARQELAELSNNINKINKAFKRLDKRKDLSAKIKADFKGQLLQENSGIFENLFDAKTGNMSTGNSKIRQAIENAVKGQGLKYDEMTMLADQVAELNSTIARHYEIGALNPETFQKSVGPAENWYNVAVKSRTGQEATLEQKVKMFEAFERNKEKAMYHLKSDEALKDAWEEIMEEDDFDELYNYQKQEEANIFESGSTLGNTGFDWNSGRLF